MPYTIVGRPIGVPDKELKKLYDYLDYRKGGVKVGRPLNILESFARRILELHSEDLKNERFWIEVYKIMSKTDE